MSEPLQRIMTKSVAMSVKAAQSNRYENSFSLKIILKQVTN